MSNHLDAVYSSLSETEKHIIDIASVATVVGALSEFLPQLAAIFTLIWTGIRIWETETVKGLTRRNKTDER